MVRYIYINIYINSIYFFVVNCLCCKCSLYLS